MKNKFKLLTSVMLLLTLGIGQVWGADVTLFSTDFSSSDWSGATFSQGNTDNKDVINGITFCSKNNTKQFSISDGKLNYPDNNPSESNYYLCIPVTGVNGSLTITIYNGTSSTRAKYQVSTSSTPSSFTGTTAGAPTSVTVSSLTESSYNVFLGRYDSSNGKVVSRIVITTPAAADPEEPVASPTGDATVSFALSGSSATGTVTGVNTISSLSTALALNTLALSGTKDGYSGAIKGCTSTTALVETDYVDVHFTVANGYAFTPSSVNVKVNPFSATGAVKAVVAIQDASLDVRSNVLSCSKNNDNEVSFASGAFTDKEFEGAVYMRIYFYGAASDKSFYIKSPLEISGIVAAADASAKYDLEFAKGDEGASGSMTTAKYKEGATVTLPACGFTAPSGKEFDTWVVTKKVGGASVTITDGKITMPAETVVATATWKTAVSDDATLSDLKVDGVTITGFAADKFIYNLEVPYGTAVADLPKITTATCNEEHATYTISPTDAPEWNDTYNCYLQQVIVTPEDGIADHKKYYHVRITFGPKLGVCLIKGNITDNAITHDAASCLKSTEITLQNSGVSGHDGGATGSKFQSGSFIKIELPEGTTFKAGDLLALNVTKITNDKLRVFNSSDNIEANIIGEGAAAMTVGVNYVTLTEDAQTLYLERGSDDSHYKNWNPHVTYVAVYRYMAPFIESFEIEGIGALAIDGTNITASVASDFDVTELTPTIKAWANGVAQIDKSNAQDFTDPVTYTVSSQYAEDATGTYAPVTYTVTITKVTPSATPTITTQPAGANYIEGATVAALSVVAEASDEGTLTYQWYLGEEAIDGATSATYTPTVSAIGSYSYTCVVTNTKGTKPAASVTSDAAVVVIASDPSCATFATASIPAESPYIYTNTDKWTIYYTNSDGKRDAANPFADVKDFEGNIVKGFAKQRCAIIFEKDMQQVRFYAAECERDWVETAPVKVSDEVSKFLESQKPTYTADAATTSMDNSYATDGKCRVFTAEGEFIAGKVYLFNFTNTVKIFKICAVEAEQKAEAPVFSGTLSDEAVCPGDAFTTLDATAAPVVSYAWYKDGELIAGATAASYTPTVAGTYYCIATNGGAGYRDNSTKSEEAVLSVNAATAITAHVDVKGDIDEEKTLSVTAEGTNLSYKWQACNENGVVTDETVLATTVTYGVTITEAPQYYLVTVEGCGTETQIVKAEKWNEYTQAHVTGSRTWDWKSSTAGWPTAENSHIDFANTGVEYLMANVSSQVPNNDEFRSDMLIGKGQYLWRNKSDGEYGFQGFTIKFYTEVTGQVRIYYRSPSSNQTSVITIDGKDAGSRGNSWGWSNYVLVGGNKEIEIAMTNGETGMTRVQKIEFLAGEDMNLAPADADYTRDLQPGMLSTTCLPNGGVIVGASIYEIAYMDFEADGTTPHKIYFDEVVDGVMEAGMPYVVLVDENSTGMSVFYTDNENKAAQSKNGLVGHIGATTALVANDYFIYNNMFYYVSETDAANGRIKITDKRAYINLSEVPGYNHEPISAPAPGRRRMAMGNGNAPKVATGCDNVQDSEVSIQKVLIDGQMFILRGEKMYDVTGRLVK